MQEGQMEEKTEKQQKRIQSAYVDSHTCESSRHSTAGKSEPWNTDW